MVDGCLRAQIHCLMSQLALLLVEEALSYFSRSLLLQVDILIISEGMIVY